jgi:tetratricopeptide (TPR) repeat protein
MKRTVLAILLAYALSAGAQDATQSQNPPAAGGASSADQAPTIKDPAEYNAYVTALQQQDPNAKVSALEAFVTQYPNSVMKTSALEQLMSTYQATGNQAKVVDSAKRLLTADPGNLRALALLTFLSRQSVMMGGPGAANSLADLQQYCAKGVDAIKANQKPAGMKDEDFEKLKKGTTLIFNSGCGFAALQAKDYQHAQEYLKAAVDQDPNDLQNVYPLGTAYNSATPPDSLNAIFYFARAAGLAPAGSDAQKQILPYAHGVYKNYHGNDANAEQLWTTYVLPTAKSNTSPPADWATKITKYVPPTPAEQAHELVTDKTSDQVKQLSFGEWELVLSAGTPEDQAKVWDVIKNVPLQMEGTVIEATSNTELHIAASQDDIEQKRSDITLMMTGPIPAARMPKPGDTFDFEGTPNAYTPTPFMMTMENGKLLKKAGEAPAKKPPVRRRTTTRKPQ